MSGVNVPSRNPGLLKTAVPMGLAAVGSIYGGPVGGMAGAKIGEGLVGGGANPGAVQGKQSAMDRRLDTTANDPHTDLVQAQQALSQLSPEDQQRYGPVLDAARQRAQQGGNV